MQYFILFIALLIPSTVAFICGAICNTTPRMLKVRWALVYIAVAMLVGALFMWAFL